MQRAIQTEIVTQRFEVGALGALAQHHLHRIARNQVDERKDQRRHQQHQRDDLGQPAEDVGRHGQVRSLRAR